MDDLDTLIRVRNRASPVFVEASPQDLITVTFTFELDAVHEAESDDPRDPRGLMVLVDALETFWGRFGLRALAMEGFGLPLGPWRNPNSSAEIESGLALAHPRSVLASTSSRADAEGARAGQMREYPRPSFNVAYSLSQGENLVATAPQVWAVIVDVTGRRNPLGQVVGEFVLERCDFWIGSAKSSGTGSITLSVGGFLLAAATFVGLQGRMEEAIRVIEVTQRIEAIKGAPCHVRGEITLDRIDLIDKATTLMMRNDRFGVCARQEMLVALGIYQGAVDGIEGEQTRSALYTFRAMWNLQQPVDPKHPVYDQTFAMAALKALSGKKPGG